MLKITYHFTRHAAIILIAAFLGLSTASATPPVRVSSGADSGPGSLREALASGTNLIVINASVTNIVIDSTLFYEGTEPLEIRGRGQTVRANNTGDDFTLLEVSNGANLKVSNMRFDGGGGFNLNNPGDGKGIFLSVPTDRTGTVRLELKDVEVMGVANHGVHVSDCTLGDDCGSGSGGGGDGSPASIEVRLEKVTVDDAGNGRFDADGVRVDERADGGISFDANESEFVNVGADGVELDEGNDGDVFIRVRRSTFNANGAYCLDAPLNIEEPCVEDDDGELVLDLDDGFDIDEAGDGSLSGTFNLSTVDDNLDEGLDFDEEGDGGVNLSLWRVEAMGNGDEGFKVSSANDGDVHVTMNRLDIVANGNDGIEIEAEDDDGEVHVLFHDSISMGNEDDGLNLAQENDMNLGTLRITGFSDVDSIDLENVVQQ